MAALFLFSTALLSLELSFTKFFSVVLWYHFGFLIISTAMLGFAVSGVYLAFRSGRTERSFSRLMTLAALVTIVAYIGMTRVAAISEMLFPSRLSSMAKIAEMAAMIGLLFAPFFFLGLTISRIITARRERAGLYYGANLLGSAFGALLFIVLFDTFRGDIGVPLNALLMLLAALIAAEQRRERFVPAIAALLLIPLLAIPGMFPLDPPRDKVLGYVNDIPVAVSYTGWSSLSKVDFIRDPDRNFGFAMGLWGISHRFAEEGRRAPERQGIVIDSWAYTTMLKYPQDISFYDYMPTTFAYSLRKYDSSLHIGAGGGLDLLAAYHYGVRSVQGVEINPVIVRAVAETFGDYSGGIYAGGLPGVEVFVDEGRHFIERSTRNWDLIQLSGVDTYSSTQAGAFALSENNLYTVEAIKSYYGKLNDNGILTMTRWFAPDENGTFRYEVRLLNLVREALRELGVGTDGNLIYFVSDNYTILTVKKGRFTEGELAAGFDFITKNRFFPLIIPGKTFDGAALFERFLNADPANFERLVAEYPYNVAPPTDDKPFYFEIRRFATLFTGTNSLVAPFNELSGQSILMMILVEVAALGLLLVLIPLILLARRVDAVRPPAAGLFYFSLIGAAFMFIEVALSQKLVLYLGHPVYALTVVLFSVLLFSGVGSMACQSFPASLRRRLIMILPILLLAIILIMPPLLSATLHHSFPVRLLVTCSITGLLAFFMGMPFPAAILRTSERETPVYWGINGFFSVVASVLTVLISINLGFTAVFIIALVLYAAASLIYLRMNA